MCAKLLVPPKVKASPLFCKRSVIKCIFLKQLFNFNLFLDEEAWHVLVFTASSVVQCTFLVFCKNVDRGTFFFHQAWQQLSLQFIRLNQILFKVLNKCLDAKDSEGMLLKMKHKWQIRNFSTYLISHNSEYWCYVCFIISVITTV